MPDDELEETEIEELLEDEEGQLLPDRTPMSILDLGEGGGLAPPSP